MVQKMNIQIMPCKFLHSAHTVLIKHFDQWTSPMLLPMALAGDEFVAQALSKYLCAKVGIAIDDDSMPQHYHSEVHRKQIDLQKCLAFLKKRMSPIQANSKLINREYMRLHFFAIEKIAKGKSLWLANDDDEQMKSFQQYCKINYLPFPSKSICRGNSKRCSPMLQYMSK